MIDSNLTRELVNSYYDKLSKKEKLNSLLSEEFLLTGTIARESIGREAYVSNNFFKGIKSLNVKCMLVEDDNACAIVSYDLISPKGNSFKAEIAEIWKIKNGKLDSVAIYFDTAFFQKAIS